jgi:DnaJ-class molecular chaperone
MTIKATTSSLAQRIRIAGERLFAKQDSLARRQGWTIEVSHDGLGRTYRDPRFDRLRPCPACDGSGEQAAGLPCGRCSGRGRITLTARAGAIAGRSR